MEFSSPKKLSYADVGSGPICMLVHGAGANKSYWKKLMEEIPSRRFLVPDLMGHGDTPGWQYFTSQKTYSYLDDVEFIHKLTEQFPDTIDLVGHSSGGAVSLVYAVQFPERIRKMVLIEPMLPTILHNSDVTAWYNIRNAYEHAHKKIDDREVAQAAQILFEYILGDGEWDKLPEKVQKWMIKNVENTLSAHSKASLSLNLDYKKIRELRSPTLILYGENTRLPYKRICQKLGALIENAKLLEIPRASHNSVLTHASEVNKLITDFLNV